MNRAPQPDAVVKYQTHREVARCQLEWTISNFKTFRNETSAMYGAGITMAELGMADDYQGRLFMSIIPCFKRDKQRTDNDTKQKFLSVFLKIADEDEDSLAYSDEREVPVEFNARVTTTGKTAQEEIWSVEDPDVYTFTSVEDEMGWSDAISHNDLFGSDDDTGLLKDDCITVSLDITVYKKPQSIQIPALVVSNTADHHQRFVTRQLNWFGSQKQRSGRGFDFTLQSSDGKEFHTSRWILMAHSPVFAAMLKHNSKETKTSRCVMVDIDGDTTEIMLSYVYGCCMDTINKGNAEKVLIMADKYQMMDLLYACEELLAKNVTVDKAVHLLVLASQRGLEKLTAAALDVVPKNMAMVLKDGALEEALQADTSLVQTIMEHCSKKMRVMDEV